MEENKMVNTEEQNQQANENNEEKTEQTEERTSVLDRIRNSWVYRNRGKVGAAVGIVVGSVLTAILGGKGDDQDDNATNPSEEN